MFICSFNMFNEHLPHALCFSKSWGFGIEQSEFSGAYFVIELIFIDANVYGEGGGGDRQKTSKRASIQLVPW